MLIYKCDDLLHLPLWWFYLLYALTEHIHVNTPNALLLDIMFCVKPRTAGMEHSVDLDNVLSHAENPVLCAGLFQFSLLSASEQKMSATVGVPESFVARKAAGQTVKKVRGKESILQIAAWKSILRFSISNSVSKSCSMSLQ